MSSFLRKFPLSYAVLWEGRYRGCVPAVHESSAARRPNRAFSTAPTGSSARTAPPRRAPDFSATRVRLHLNPGQKAPSSFSHSMATALSACAIAPMPSGRRGSRPWSSSSPNAIGNRHGVFLPTTGSLSCASPSPTWPSGRVKQAGRMWSPARRVWQLRYDRVLALGLTNRIVDEPASSTRCPEPGGRHLDTDARTASR